MTKQDYKRLSNDWEKSETSKPFYAWLFVIGLNDDQVDEILDFAREDSYS